MSIFNGKYNNSADQKSQSLIFHVKYNMSTTQTLFFKWNIAYFCYFIIKFIVFYVKYSNYKAISLQIDVFVRNFFAIFFIFR